MKKRYRTRLEAEADEFLRYIGVGAKRMEELVWDLLAYTRAGSSGDGPVDVTDSQAVLEQVLENLKPPIEPSHGQVTDDPLPVALIRPRHLEQLFHNLSCNSLKYRKESESRVYTSAPAGKALPGASRSRITGSASRRSTTRKSSAYLSGCTATTTGTPEPASGWRSVIRSWSATAGVSGSNRSKEWEAFSISLYLWHPRSIWRSQ